MKKFSILIKYKNCCTFFFGIIVSPWGHKCYRAAIGGPFILPIPEARLPSDRDLERVLRAALHRLNTPDWVT